MQRVKGNYSTRNGCGRRGGERHGASSARIAQSQHGARWGEKERPALCVRLTDLGKKYSSEEVEALALAVILAEPSGERGAGRRRAWRFSARGLSF